MEYDKTDFSKYDALQLQKMCEQVEHVSELRDAKGKFVYNRHELTKKIQRIFEGRGRIGKGTGPRY